MTLRKPSVLNIALVALVAVATGCQQAHKDTKSSAAKAPEMQLPPGWTAEDMKACELAATPGPMHEWLQKGVGTWHGKNTIWMGPGAPAQKSESTTTVSSMFDGRYVKVELKSDMGGMPFNGFGIYGFDNVAQKFQGAWIDNCGTTVSTATGEVSKDGKTMTWTYTFTCPINKKPTTMRQVEKTVSENERTMEMYTADPKSGKEYKMMEVQMTRRN